MRLINDYICLKLLYRLGTLKFVSLYFRQMHAQVRLSHLCSKLASFPVSLNECPGIVSQNGSSLLKHLLVVSPSANNTVQSLAILSKLWIWFVGVFWSSSNGNSSKMWYCSNCFLFFFSFPLDPKMRARKWIQGICYSGWPRVPLQLPFGFVVNKRLNSDH